MNKLINVTTIKVSDLKGDTRIDADRYKKEYLVLEDVVKNIPSSQKLHRLIEKPVRGGHTPTNRDIKNHDEKVFFIKTNTLRDGLIKFENADFLPEKVLRKNHFLIPGEVIVTIIGAHFNIIGRAAIFRTNNKKSVVNQNIAVIKANKSKLNPYYLSAFLNSNYGKKQLWMLSRQTEQVNLNFREVEQVYIPLFSNDFQNNMSGKVIKFYEDIENAKNLYSKARLLVDEKTRVSKLKNHENTYTVTLSYVRSKNRIDAEYFRPLYEQLCEMINEHPYGNKFLLDTVNNIAGDAKPGAHPDQFFRYVELSDVDSTLGVIHGSDKIQGKNTPTRAKRILETNDVIVSNVQGSLSKVALVHQDYKKALASSGFFQFRANTISSELLLAMTKSSILQLLLKREATGSILSSVPPENLNHIKIPVLKKETQNEITTLVKKSHRLWNLAIRSYENILKTIDKKVEKESK